MKLRFIVLFSLVFVCMLFTSCSFAMTTNTKSTIIEQLQTLTDKGVISQATTDKLTLELNKDSTFKTSNGYGDNYFILIGKGSRYNGGGHNWYTLSTSTKIYIGCCSTSQTLVNNLNNSVTSVFYTFWNFQGSIYCDISGNTGYGYDVGAFNDAIEGFYLYTTIDIDTRLIQLSAGQEYGGEYLLNYGPTFEPVNNGKIQVYNSNHTSSELMNRLPFSYNGDIYWTLGYIANFDGVKNIEGYFGPLVYDSGDTITDNSLNSFNYDYYYGTSTKNLYFDASTGRVAINKNALLNKQAYNLILSYQEDFNTGYEYFTDVWYYSYFYNQYISSGDSISSDLNSTVDIGFVGALNDFFNTTSGDKENINRDINDLFGVGTFFSGDFLSGDFLKDSGYKDYYKNDYSLFLYTIYDNVIDILLDDTIHNEYLEFNLHGNNYRFYSNDFLIPNNALKTMVTLFLVTGLFMLLIQQIHGFIITINTLDINGLTHSFDRQHTFFM